MATKNYNIRVRNGKTDEDRAWEHLHSEEVRHSFRSQNGFVIAAINDFYDRHLCISKDPYGGSTTDPYISYSSDLPVPPAAFAITSSLSAIFLFSVISIPPVFLIGFLGFLTAFV